ncbi:hypothetical protein M9H77_18273 [Catharanthus roseus]|uniref:Uncharacterized protein n=1 Tax=Catharanthus roseus TaxID=4058 RepID=A0ACC0B6Z7_CATRO|nr:hypothetical protein M9H77_18273 [Catharanthus roseus]
MENLPSPIIADILIRLPTKAIVQSRCVCKTWLKLTSNSDFINLHLLKSTTGLIINNLSSSPTDDESFLFNFVEIEGHHDLHYVTNSKMELPKSGGSNMTMVGSINGLVCLNEFDHQFDVLHIWNPTMRHSISVQTPNGVKRADPNIVRYGFGIISSESQTYHYRVARIFQEPAEFLHSSECQVYNLEDGSWKSIGHAPFRYNSLDHGIFLNGSLHWLIDDPDGSEFISCMDIEKERFKPFPPPPGLSKDRKTTLNIYKGCLSVCDNTADSEIVIWVMEEYGVKKSWRKEVVIPRYPLFGGGRFYDVVRVVKVFKDGEILLLERDDMVSLYHPEKKTWESVDGRDLIGATKKRTCEFSVLHPPIQAMDYVPTILSLKNFGTLNISI